MEYNPHIIKMKLDKLLNELGDRRPNTIGNVHFADDKFVIKFPLNFSGYETANKILTTFHECGLIGHEELEVMKGDLNKKPTVITDKCSLSIEHNTSTNTLDLSFIHLHQTTKLHLDI